MNKSFFNKVTGALCATVLVVGAALAACSSNNATVDTSVEAGLNCGDGAQACGATCTVLARDPQNCGACGTACKTGEVCSAGKCASSCAGGSTQCGSSCVSTQTDGANCGACGTACKAGEVCSAGKCGTSCGAGTQQCGQSCVNEQTDNANCGACGNLCGAGTACAAGKCAPTCQAGLTLCTASAPDAGAPDASVSDAAAVDASVSDAGPSLGANYCANLQSDDQNCGGCGIVCGNGTACVNGACAASCGAGSTLCQVDGGANYCAVLDSDNKNCGACGNACAANKQCVNGKCNVAGCVAANGLNWCWDSTTCGVACNGVCSKFGLTPAPDNTVFAAQNSAQLCTNISSALGIAAAPQIASWTYGCVEDTGGVHNGQLIGPLLCSSYNGCPLNHRTSMDSLGVACNSVSSRVSICACQ